MPERRTLWESSDYSLACSRFAHGSVSEREVKIIVSLRPEQRYVLRVSADRRIRLIQSAETQHTEIGAEKASPAALLQTQITHGSNPATLRSPNSLSFSISLSNSDASKR